MYFPDITYSRIGIVLLTTVFLFSAPLKADQCVKFYLPKSENESALDSITYKNKRVLVTLSNYDDVAKNINEKLIEVLQLEFPSLLRSELSIGRYTNEILKHILENTIQHGTNDFTSVTVDFAIRYNREFIFIDVTNPQVKPFPSYLQRKFSKEDRIEVPYQQRIGFTGNGVALAGLISSSRQRLPDGSTISWQATGDKILFRLQIKVDPI